MRTASFTVAAIAVAALTASGSAEAGDPGIVTIAGGAAGWVSLDYLHDHPNAIPGVVAQTGPIKSVNADGCDGDVCISLRGHGLTVDTWTATYMSSNGSQGCLKAYFITAAPGGTAQGQYNEPVCPTTDRPGVYYDSRGPHGWFADKTSACNSWVGVSGYACETIKQ